MANTKISALPAGAPAVATDLIPIDRAGANYSLQVSDVLGQALPRVVASRVVTNSSTVDGNFTQTFYTIPVGAQGVYRMVVGIVARTQQAGAWQVNADWVPPSGTNQAAQLGVAVNMVTGALAVNGSAYSVTAYYHAGDVITVGTVTGSGTPGVGAFDVAWVLERLV